MKTQDFNFDLPESLIAQSPPEERGQSRLMVLNRKTGRREHRMVRELPGLLEKGTLLVFNNSKVRKARLFGVSENSPVPAEFLLLKKLNCFDWLVLAKRSKRRKPGSRYLFNGIWGTIVSPEQNAAGDSADKTGEGELVLRFERPIDDDWLDRFGHVPLPPYIKRNDTDADSERYQTVYASQTGSAAAPTAGLHFTAELLADLDSAGMEMVFVTLHVGLGTFLPVRTDNIEDHRMHEETYFIGEDEAEKIEKAKREKRKILTVGTTSLRTLESAWKEDSACGRLQRGEGNTSIFIYPGFVFKAADALFTNFHTPASTLLMLVSAFAEAGSGPPVLASPALAGPVKAGTALTGPVLTGRDFILESYREAVREGYRFFSYGDACLIQ